MSNIAVPRTGHSGIPDWWLSRPIFQKGLLVLMIPVVTIVVLFIAFIGLRQRAADTSDAVTHTAQVQTQLIRIQGLTVDIETGVRGYLLTGEETYLDPYRSAKGHILEDVDTLATLVDDNEVQSNRVRVLRSDIKKDLALFAKLKATESGGNLHNGAAALLAQTKTVTDKIRSNIRAMYDTEQLLLQERSADVESARSLSYVLAVIGVVVGLIGGVLAMYLFANSVVKRLNNSARNAERLAQGLPVTPPVSAARDEIGILDRSMTAASGLLIESRSDLEKSRNYATALANLLADKIRRPIEMMHTWAETYTAQEDIPVSQRQAADTILQSTETLLQVIDSATEPTR